MTKLFVSLEILNVHMQGAFTPGASGDEVTEALELSLKFRMYDNVFLLCQEFMDRMKHPRILYYYAKAYLETNCPIQASILFRKYEDVVARSQDLVVLYARSLFECGSYSEAERILQGFNPHGACEITTPNEAAVAANYLSAQIKMRTHRYIQGQEDFAKCERQHHLMLYPLLMKRQKTGAPMGRPTFGAGKKEKTPEQERTRALSFTALLLGRDTTKVGTDVPEEALHSISVMKQQAISLFWSVNYREAAAVFQQIYDRYPFTVEGVDVYSSTLWQLKDEPTLRELARRTVEIAPSRPETWVVVGNLASMKGQSDKAIDMFERAIKLNSGYSYAYTLAGHELLILDSLKDAMDYFRKATDINPHDWSAWLGLASCHYREEKFVPAEYYAKKALSINPQSSVVYYLYSLNLSGMKRYDEALQMVEKALELQPRNLVAASEKVRILQALGRLDEAKAYIDQVKGLQIREPCIAYLRGSISQQLGEVQDAVYWYSAAVAYGYKITDDLSKLFSQFIEQASATDQ